MKASMLYMVLGIISIAISFVVFPIVLDASSTVLGHEGQIVDVHENVTTGAAETTADVVLRYALLDGLVANVVSITSSEGTDTPTADSYVEASRTLTVGGLTADTTRTLTITYKTDISAYTGLGSIVKVAPLIVLKKCRAPTAFMIIGTAISNPDKAMAVYGQAGDPVVLQSPLKQQSFFEVKTRPLVSIKIAQAVFSSQPRVSLAVQGKTN